jgi:hypothetical protein
LIESSAWKNFRAKRKELASILVEKAKNDSTTVDPEIIGSQDALDEVNNELQKSEDKADIIGDAIEKKLL